MKKTLVALAALAATGAFAQVAITGTYAAGYQLNTSTAGATTSGFGVDTASLAFNAKEDLGGGWSVSATMGVDALTSNTATGGDNQITLTTGAGAFTFDQSKGSDFISRSVGQTAGVGMDGKVFGAAITQAANASDAFIYTLPLSKEITFNFVHAEADRALGTGAAGSNPVNGAQRGNELRLGYKTGAINATLRYAAYENPSVANNTSSRLRAAATYDLGVAKIGAAFESRNYDQVGNRNDTGLSASFPIGALTLGVNYASRTSQTAANGSWNGYGLSADYALSKRTSLSASYGNWNASNADTNRATATTFLLAHSF